MLQLFRHGPVRQALSLFGQRPTLAQALAHFDAPAGERWKLSGARELPRDEWHSFDRTPWLHPWLTPRNIAEFAQFSRSAIAELERRVPAGARRGGHYGFAGNIANIGYMRAVGLRRLGLDIEVFPYPSDTYPFSLPAWEEFDGTLDELGPDPSAALLARPTPEGVAHLPLDHHWRSTLEEGAEFPAPESLLRSPDYMVCMPMLRRLHAKDALLVSQVLPLGPLSQRPYLVGQMGGEVWFDAARNDALGLVSRAALHGAAAVLVSNPITLAHARRYGLRNVLYLPLVLDEERYRPGPEGAAERAAWQRQLGGDFFVLTSMRLDRRWKGAQHALEGVARAAAELPGLRLVALAWGDDRAALEAALAERGLADRVLFLPPVGKRRLIRYLQAADVLIEQFVLGYYGASALEAMACGTPVVMRLERAQYDALHETGAPPVLDAEDGAAVAAQLCRLARDPARAAATARVTREWFLATHAAGRWRDTYELLLAAAAAGIPVDYDRSPLRARLRRAERAYQAAQRAGAPAFPHYTDS